MLNVLLLCYGLLQGIQAILTSDLSHGHLQKMSAGLYGADRARYSSLLRKVKDVAVEPAGESGAPRPLLAHPGPQNRSGEPTRSQQLPCSASVQPLSILQELFPGRSLIIWPWRSKKLMVTSCRKAVRWNRR